MTQATPSRYSECSAGQTKAASRRSFAILVIMKRIWGVQFIFLASFVVFLFLFLFLKHFLLRTPDVSSGSVAQVDSSEIIYGSTTSLLRVIEYYDLECPYCKSYHESLANNPGLLASVGYVYRPFPLVDIHSGASEKNVILLCAAQQESQLFIPGMEYAYTHLESTIEEYENYFLEKVSSKQDFEMCIDTKAPGADISESVAKGKLLGIYGTPSLIFLDTQKGKQKVFSLVGARQGVNFIETFIQVGGL